MMTEQLNLSLAEWTFAKNNFTGKYHGASFADIQLNWAALQSAIASRISWPANQTLLRFIHRYENGTWFLTMECCHVDANGYIDIFGPRLDLKNGSIQDTLNFAGDYDPAYFSHVTYDGGPVVHGLHVQYATLPWTQELQEASRVNDVLTDQDVNIVFSSISFDFGESSDRVAVRWPHSVGFYFASGNIPIMDNIMYSHTGPLIKAKLYDYADMCPSNCTNSGSYQWSRFFNDTRPYQS